MIIGFYDSPEMVNSDIIANYSPCSWSDSSSDNGSNKSSAVVITWIGLFLLVEEDRVGYQLIPALECLVHRFVDVLVMKEDNFQVFVFPVKLVWGAGDMDVNLSKNAMPAAGKARQGRPGTTTCGGSGEIEKISRLYLGVSIFRFHSLLYLEAISNRNG